MAAAAWHMQDRCCSRVQSTTSTHRPIQISAKSNKLKQSRCLADADSLTLDWRSLAVAARCLADAASLTLALLMQPG